MTNRKSPPNEQVVFELRMLMLKHNLSLQELMRVLAALERENERLHA